MKLADLHALARLTGVQTAYEDAGGKRREASRDALVDVLAARLGEAPTSDALERRRRELRERGIEPVIVAWDGRHVPLDLRLPASLASAKGEWLIAIEEGDEHSGAVDLSSGEVVARDGDFVRVSARIEKTLPPGYHALTLRLGGRVFESLVISAPLRAHQPQGKTWGVFVPLYGAHSRGSWGTGDLGDLLAYTEWLDHHGGSVVATLPVLAAFPDEPSPYSPLSRLFWNELYLDIDRLPELRADDVDAGAVANARQTTDVDYQRVLRLKRPLLEKLATRVTRDEAFETFAATAREYAAFRARIEQRDSVDYHLYVQYRMAQQMRESAAAARKSGVGLYLDFPLGVNAGGYDAWKYRHVFAPNIAVGAPPDLFFTKGQNWGFPPLDPDAARNDRYAYLRACIRMHAEHAGVLRIDHVMGLHRLFWIPEGQPASEGLYVRYAEEELYAILTVESQRSRCTVVGEDLGTVPQYVPAMMEKHGIRRMYVVQYEAKPQDPPLGRPPAESVASINTHDMPTFTAWWRGIDIDDRVEQALLDAKSAENERATREQLRRKISGELVSLGIIDRTSDPARILEGLLVFLAMSDAEIALINLEDLWGELAPQNVPGVPDRSWRHKLRLSLEQAMADGTVRRVIDRVNAVRPRIR